MRHIHEEDIVRRLHSLAEQPVDPSVAERHTSCLAAAAPAVVAHRRRRPVVTAAFLAGALLGGTGLAAAVTGSLPEQASDMAKAMVGADDDDPRTKAEKAKAKAEKAKARAEAKGAKGPKVAGAHGVTRYYGPECSGMATADYNHGQYVKAHPDDPATTEVNEREIAAQSRCGKPIQATDDPAGGEATTEANKGKPADAGNKPAEAGKPADAGNKPAEAGNPAAPAQTGRPDGAGKSEETHPPSTPAAEQGSENPSTGAGNADDATPHGRPEGVGPPSS